MSHLRFSTAGESHGPAEVCLIEGVPAGLSLTAHDVNAELARRQRGYGRGGRMAIERDQVRILAGVRWGRTIGSPVAFVVENLDHANWLPAMQPEPLSSEEIVELGVGGHRAITVPRPGHADLGGVAKYDFDDIRNVLERSSARETVGRVCAGAVAKLILRELGAWVRARVTRIGLVSDTTEVDFTSALGVDWEAVESSSCACLSLEAEARMRESIDEASAAGESLGGIIEVWGVGLPPGIGGYAGGWERLDGRLMGAVGSIPAIKGVEVGAGFEGAGRVGSAVHDPILSIEGENGVIVVRPSNRAGGIEGGMTNGMPVILRAAMKPIPTLTTPLPSVDLDNMRPIEAHKERSDVTAVAAAAVVVEAMSAVVLAAACLEQFGGDCMSDLAQSFASYVARLEDRHLWAR